MPNKRDLKLYNYEIDSDLYRELFYFCKQYKARQKEMDELRGLSSVDNDGMPRGNRTGDQTAIKAIKMIRLEDANKIIEQSAIAADSGIYAYILKNVTEGIPYEFMKVPCGRVYFYSRRRLFFKILSERR